MTRSANRNPVQMVPMSKIIIKPGLNARTKTETFEPPKAPRAGKAAPKPEAGFLLLQTMETGVQLQACVGVQTDDGVLLVAGFRRYQAAKKLGWDVLEVKVLPEMPEGEMLFLNLTENVARSQLTLPDLSKRIFEIKDLTKIGYKEIAHRIGKSLSHTTGLGRIWANVDPTLLEHWQTGRYSDVLHFDSLITLSTLTRPEQLQWFHLQTEPGGDSTVERQKNTGTKKKSARGAPRRELVQLRGLLRNGHYDKQGSDWITGATAVLDLVLDRKEMAAPDDLDG